MSAISTIVAVGAAALATGASVTSTVINNAAAEEQAKMQKKAAEAKAAREQTALARAARARIAASRVAGGVGGVTGSVIESPQQATTTAFETGAAQIQSGLDVTRESIDNSTDISQFNNILGTVGTAAKAGSTVAGALAEPQNVVGAPPQPLSQNDNFVDLQNWLYGQ